MVRLCVRQVARFSAMVRARWMELLLVFGNNLRDCPHRGIRRSFDAEYPLITE